MNDFIDRDGYINCIARSDDPSRSDPNVWACIRLGFFKELKFNGKSLAWIVRHGDEAASREASRLRNANETMCSLRKRYRDHLFACEACTRVGANHAQTETQPQPAAAPTAPATPEPPPSRARDRIIADIAGLQC